MPHESHRLYFENKVPVQWPAPNTPCRDMFKKRKKKNKRFVRRPMLVEYHALVKEETHTTTPQTITMNAPLLSVTALGPHAHRHRTPGKMNAVMLINTLPDTSSTRIK
mmetsp:Transcript_29278/g.77381  ORF Transcript_29278/g.77381 Transcript_29278/m.77381 type:complete len:108 (-) Transcript_29278:798-1121(-)